MADGLSARRLRQWVWFERWLSEGYSIRQLGKQSGYAVMTLRRIIHWWLDRPPLSDIGNLAGARHVIVDGAYLHGRQSAFVLVWDHTTSRLIAGGYGIKEGHTTMQPFCEALAARGLNPISITTDGHRGLVQTLRRVWPEAILQRCLFHMRKQGMQWCRRRPTRPAARQLRSLFAQLCSLRTPGQRDAFMVAWTTWEQRYGQAIADSRRGGWVFPDLQQARRLIHRALPDMFHYLDNPGIPQTTSAVEGCIGRFKQQYRRHRGLADHRVANLFQWYFHVLR